MFLTIRETAKKYGLKESMLRARLANKRLPGFYSGSRFNVDVEALLKLLHDESNAMVEAADAAV